MIYIKYQSGKTARMLAELDTRSILRGQTRKKVRLNIHPDFRSGSSWSHTPQRRSTATSKFFDPGGKASFPSTHALLFVSRIVSNSAALTGTPKSCRRSERFLNHYNVVIRKVRNGLFCLASAPASDCSWSATVILMKMPLNISRIFLTTWESRIKV